MKRIRFSVGLSRRHFLKTTTTAGLGLITSRMAAGPLQQVAGPLQQAAGSTQQAAGSAVQGADSRAFPGKQEEEDLYVLSHSLSATWAETLLGLQVLDTSRPDDYGGIRCPTEHIVHGRVGDTIYPFLHMAHQTKDSRYLDASVLLYRWMERRVSQPDGSWLNEPVKGSWKGTTVFSSIALGEAIQYHGELMDPAFKRALQDRLMKAGDFIYNNITIDYGNINYPLSASYAMSLLGTLLDAPRFRERGRVLARQGLNFISRNDGFIYGEGTPYYEASKKGCFSVDLGYNVEETLPSLALYGLLNRDEEVLDAVTRSLQTHMEFLLPDGGWDNSWGTRNYKWTYWGSRTSDGCQPAYALLAGRDQRFYRVALKNTQLLQQCTHGGLLYGGPHYITHHVPPSVHHTFCHIKALTTILDHGRPGGSASAGSDGTPSGDNSTLPGDNSAYSESRLPRESAYGSRFFADIQTWLIAIGGYRATVTGYDREYKGVKNGHASGGALSMLWHEGTGPLLAASMNTYQLVEAGNMQVDNDPLSLPLTPRMELTADGVQYMNCSDLEADVTVENEGEKIIVHTRSRLVDKDQRDPPQGAIHCNTYHTFTAEKIMLSFSSSSTPYDKAIRIVLPVISTAPEPVQIIDERTIHIHKEKTTVTIAADKTISRLPTTGNRLFNFVPGLEALPLAILSNEAVIEITVTG